MFSTDEMWLRIKSIAMDRSSPNSVRQSGASAAVSTSGSGSPGPTNPRGVRAPKSAL